jgi:hypothetical protein
VPSIMPAVHLTTPVDGAPPLLIEYSTLPFEQWAAERADVPSASAGEERCGRQAQLAAAFNAGVWGYDSWRPAIRLVCASRCPLLVTVRSAARRPAHRPPGPAAQTHRPEPPP